MPILRRFQLFGALLALTVMPVAGNVQAAPAGFNLAQLKRAITANARLADLPGSTRLSNDELSAYQRPMQKSSLPGSTRACREYQAQRVRLRMSTSLRETGMAW